MRSLLITLLFLAWGLNAQVQIEDNRISFSQIHEVEGSKTDLHKWASEWVAKTYNNSNYVTRINDEEQIITKGAFEVVAIQTILKKEYPQTRRINYTLNVQFKVGRYKLDINDLNIEPLTEAYPDELETYFMDKEQYREYLRKFYENMGGSYLKRGLKILENDNKFNEFYENNKKYGAGLHLGILANLEGINQSLLAYMKQDHGDDDW